MTTPRQITSELASYIARIDSRHLPSDVLQVARLCMLDWMGNAVAGASTQGPSIVRTVLRQTAGPGASTVIGGDFTLDAAAAALLNGCASHALEFGDVHPLSYTHPSATVLATAFAVGEERSSSTDEVMGAFAAGYETMARVGLSIGETMFKKHHVHPHGFLGYLGAAAAAGKLFGLSEKQLVMALGVAGAQAGGLLESAGTMSECYSAGYPGFGGVVSARLAEAGFLGPAEIVAGHSGIFASFGAQRDMALFDDDDFEIRRNFFKLYPSCGFTHPMLDGILQLRAQAPADTRWDEAGVTIRLWTDAANHVDRLEPQTALQAQFSAPFCAAVAILYGSAGPDQFIEERLNDPKVAAMARSVRIERDDGMNRYQSKVSIEAGGKTWERYVSHENLAPEEGEIVRKFVSLTDPIWGRQRAERAAQMILDPKDRKVSELMQILRPAGLASEGY